MRSRFHDSNVTELPPSGARKTSGVLQVPPIELALIHLPSAKPEGRSHATRRCQASRKYPLAGPRFRSAPASDSLAQVIIDPGHSTRPGKLDRKSTRLNSSHL